MISYETARIMGTVIGDRLSRHLGATIIIRVHSRVDHFIFAISIDDKSSLAVPVDPAESFFACVQRLVSLASQHSETR